MKTLSQFFDQLYLGDVVLRLDDDYIVQLHETRASSIFAGCSVAMVIHTMGLDKPIKIYDEDMCAGKLKDFDLHLNTLIHTANDAINDYETRQTTKEDILAEKADLANDERKLGL